MQENWDTRTELIIGSENIQKLKNTHVLIAGLGGVGGYVAEMLARSGVGELTVIDSDVISKTNKNRQIIALDSTIGKSKVDIITKRLVDINSEIVINKKEIYLTEGTIEEVLIKEYDYIVDAIDTLTPKIHFIKICLENKLRLISSLGAGAKLDPSKILVTDISKSYNDNLARILRKRLHRIGIKTGFKVVFSSESVIKTAIIETEGERNKRSTIGSISYMPAIFGINIAATVIKDIIDD